MKTEKLELAHLAPYLPYGLKVQWQSAYLGAVSEELYSIYGRTEDVRINITPKGSYHKLSDLKPILRPLSDFGVEVAFGNNTFKSDEYIATSIKDSQLNHRIINEHSNCDRLEQWKFERLCQMHFDVFGLIDKGLAISIHDINK